MYQDTPNISGVVSTNIKTDQSVFDKIIKYRYIQFADKTLIIYSKKISSMSPKF